MNTHKISKVLRDYDHILKTRTPVVMDGTAIDSLKYPSAERVSLARFVNEYAPDDFVFLIPESIVRSRRDVLDQVFSNCLACSVETHYSSSDMRCTLNHEQKNRHVSDELLSVIHSAKESKTHIGSRAALYIALSITENKGVKTYVVSRSLPGNEHVLRALLNNEFNVKIMLPGDMIKFMRDEDERASVVVAGLERKVKDCAVAFAPEEDL